MWVCMHLKPTPAGINWKIRPKRRRTTTTSTATTWNSFAHKLLGVFGQSINHFNARTTKLPPTLHPPFSISFSPGRQAGRKTARFSTSCCCCLGACQDWKSVSKCSLWFWSSFRAVIDTAGQRVCQTDCSYRGVHYIRYSYMIYIYDIDRVNCCWDWLIHNQMADPSATLTLFGFLILSSSLSLSRSYSVRVARPIKFACVCEFVVLVLQLQRNSQHD